MTDIDRVLTKLYTTRTKAAEVQAEELQKRILRKLLPGKTATHVFNRIVEFCYGHCTDTPDVFSITKMYKEFPSEVCKLVLAKRNGMYSNKAWQRDVRRLLTIAQMAVEAHMN